MSDLKVWLTIPSGTRRQYLEDIIKDSQLPLDQIVIVHTVESEPIEGVRNMWDLDPPNIQRWWNTGIDIARANVMAMEHLQTKDSFTTDIFTGTGRTLLDVIEEYKINGLTIDYTVLGLEDADTIPTLDNRHVFGWKPAYTFKQAIQSEIKEK